MLAQDRAIAFKIELPQTLPIPAKLARRSKTNIRFGQPEGLKRRNLPPTESMLENIPFDFSKSLSTRGATND